MKFKVEWVENKTPEWKVATLSTSDGMREENVSVNKVNKKGEPFPNFEGITPGAEIDGEFWKSDSGKSYLFAPKPVPTYKTFSKTGMGDKLIEKKQEGIKQSQENKAEGIKISSTARMAHENSLAEQTGEKLDKEMYMQSYKYWRSFHWNAWDDTDPTQPFN
jgi:hypothetical protein